MGQKFVFFNLHMIFSIVVGDILANSVEDVDDTMPGEIKGGLKATAIKSEEECKKYTLHDIAMPVIGSKILYFTYE